MQKVIESRWINITDRKPKEGQRCLIVNGKNNIVIGVYKPQPERPFKVKQYFENLGGNPVNGIYWMELPDLPEER